MAGDLSNFYLVQGIIFIVGGTPVPNKWSSFLHMVFMK